MKTLKSLTLSLAAAILTFAMAVAQQTTDLQAVQPKPEFTPYGRLQTMGFGQTLNDNVEKDQRLYLYLKEARFGVLTNYEDMKFDLQVALGGEDQVVASSGMSLSLLDFSVAIPVTKSLNITVGQFKVPYGREGMTNSGAMQFTDRSIQYDAFKVGRDVGFALVGNSGNLTGTFGVFTGGGRDVPLRFIPENMGIPMLVLRAGINNGYDENAFDLSQSTDNSSEGSAIYFNALYTKDSRIGHSTALNVKAIDKSLILDNMWNPYIGKTPYVKGDFWQAGLDAAFRKPLNSSTTLSGEGEVNYGGYSNIYGSILVSGGRAQVALTRLPVQVALRYSVIAPDNRFAYVDSKGTSYKIVDSKFINEITLGASYFLKGDHLKLTADLPVLIGVPVINDPVSGAYVLTEQADQVSYVGSTGAKIARQTVVEARLQLQYAF